MEPVKKSIVYRRCERLYDLLISAGYEKTISLKDLQHYITQEIAGSPSTVKRYFQLMCEFGFIKKDIQKSGFYMVDRENNFFSQEPLQSQTSEESHIGQDVKTAPRMDSGGYEAMNGEQSKTLVHLSDRGPKRSCSFKGYEVTWDAFKSRVVSMGLDICYVMDAWENAFLQATAQNSLPVNVSTPIQYGPFVLNVTVVLPYVVQRPRRFRRKTVEEEAEF